MISGRLRQYLVTLAVSLSAVATGFSLSWSTPVIPKFHSNVTGLNITEGEISWLVALTSPGFMTGSLICRFMSDRAGRKATILGSALPFVIGTVIILNSSKAWMISLARYLWGIGNGLTRTVIGMYISEISDKEIRGTLLAADRFMLNFGMFACMSIGPFVSYQALNYVMLFLPICYFIACLFIHETPYFLIKQGKVNRARKALRKFSKNNDENLLEEKLTGLRADIRKEMLRSGSLKELFTKQYRKVMIIVLGVKLTQIMVGSLVIQQYSARIVQESQADISLTTALIVFGAVRFIIGMLTVVIADRIGRRPLLLYSHFFSGIVLSIMAIYYFMESVLSPIYRYIPFAGLIIISTLSTGGYATAGYILVAEVFPINIKSVGMTFVHIYGGFLAFVAAKGYQEIKDISGFTGVFLFYGLFGFIGAVFTYFIVPETKGKSLREIQIELQGNIYDGDDQKLDRELEVFNEEKNTIASPNDLEYS